MKKFSALIVLFILINTPSVSLSQSPILSTDWHPDPDGDGILTDVDLCPHIYDPNNQNDTDGDGLGDYCDPDFAFPVENDSVTDLRVEHVTPYGAWLRFTSPKTVAYGWRGGIAWSTDINELASASTVQALPLYVDDHILSNYQRENFLGRIATPYGYNVDFTLRDMGTALIRADLEPSTIYYAVVYEYDYTSSILWISNIIQFQTQPEPALTIANQHPSLLMTPSELTALQQRYQNNDARLLAWLNSGVLGRIERAAQDVIYQSYDYCTTAALIYHIRQTQADLDNAIAIFDLLMQHYADGFPGETNNSFDLDYYRWIDLQGQRCTDLLWYQLDEARLIQAIDLIQYQDYSVESGRPTYDGQGNVTVKSELFYDTDVESNTTRSLLASGLLACGASDLTINQQALGCDTLDYAKRRWFGINAVRIMRDDGKWGLSGGQLEDGIEYGIGTQVHWLDMLTLLSNAGYPITEYQPWVIHTMHAMLVHPMTPSGLGYVPLEDTDIVFPDDAVEGNSIGLEHLEIMRTSLGLTELLTRVGAIQEAQWAYQIYRDYTHIHAAPVATFGILYDTDSREGVDHRTAAPTAYVDTGFGVFYDRSDWTTDASYIAGRIGWGGVDHTHAECGHFSFYRQGQWLTHEATGYTYVTLREIPEAHNTLLLDSAIDRNSEGIINTAPLAPTQQEYFAATIRGVIRANTAPNYFALIGDCTNAYNAVGSRATQFYDSVQRNIIWRKDSSDILVIHDLIDANDLAPSTINAALNYQIPYGSSNHSVSQVEVNHAQASATITGSQNTTVSWDVLVDGGIIQQSLLAVPNIDPDINTSNDLYNYRFVTRFSFSKSVSAQSVFTILQSGQAHSPMLLSGVGGSGIQAGERVFGFGNTPLINATSGIDVLRLSNINDPVSEILITGLIPNTDYDYVFDGTQFILNVGSSVQTDASGTLLLEFSHYDVDTNQDGLVTPVDAIFVINHIGEQVSSGNELADINQDGQITDMDVLLVIDRYP